MKKGIFLIFLVLLILSSFVSASFLEIFFDSWLKEVVPTGNIISGAQSGATLPSGTPTSASSIPPILSGTPANIPTTLQPTTDLLLGGCFSKESDYGLNLVQKGSYKDVNMIIEDECLADAEGRIYETLCLGPNMNDCNCQRIVFTCPFGTTCNNGSCIFQETTEEIDSNYDYDNLNRLNIFRFGKYFVNGELITDGCDGSNYILEGGFDLSLNRGIQIFPGDTSRVRIKCPEGLSCVNGKCIGAAISCNPLLPGWNSENPESRFNFVFVGADYHRVFSDHTEALNAFKRDIHYALGLNPMSPIGFAGDHSHALGLFEVEPYKSYKSQFNIWYVDRFVEGSLPPSDWAGDAVGRVERWNEMRYSGMGTSSICDLDKKILILLEANMGQAVTSAPNVIAMNTNRGPYLTPDLVPPEFQATEESIQQCMNFYQDLCNYSVLLSQSDRYGSPIVDRNNDGCITYSDDIKYMPPNLFSFLSSSSCPEVTRNYAICQDPFAEQEINDICTGMAPQYQILHELAHVFGFADTRVPTENDIVPQQPRAYMNCYVAASQEECRLKSPWHQLIGNDCGQEGVEDCSLGTDPDEDANLEITCHPGCLDGIQSYRATPTGIMPYGTASSGLGENYYTFNAWEEWILKKFIGASLQTPRPPPDTYTPSVSTTKSAIAIPRAIEVPSYSIFKDHSEGYIDISRPSIALKSNAYISLDGLSPLQPRINLSPKKPYKKDQATLSVKRLESQKIQLTFSNTLQLSNGQIITIHQNNYRVGINKDGSVTFTQIVGPQRAVQPGIGKQFPAPAKISTVPPTAIFSKLASLFR